MRNVEIYVNDSAVKNTLNEPQGVLISKTSSSGSLVFGTGYDYDIDSGETVKLEFRISTNQWMLSWIF